MTRPRAADDFPVIRARMEELRRERALSRPTTTPHRASGAPLYADTRLALISKSRSRQQFAGRYGGDLRSDKLDPRAPLTILCWDPGAHFFTQIRPLIRSHSLGRDRAGSGVLGQVRPSEAQ